MIITAVRVRKLMSGPGFSHHAIEAEAAVMDGDDPATIREELTAWVDGQLRGHREIEELHELRDGLREQVHALERQRDAQKREIDNGRKVLREHTEIRKIAEKAGLDVPEALADPLPF